MRYVWKKGRKHLLLWSIACDVWFAAWLLQGVIVKQHPSNPCGMLFKSTYVYRSLPSCHGTGWLAGYQDCQNSHPSLPATLTPKNKTECLQNSTARRGAEGGEVPTTTTLTPDCPALLHHHYRKRPHLRLRLRLQSPITVNLTTHLIQTYLCPINEWGLDGTPTTRMK